MTLFDRERRVPTVTDMDGDGLNDLIVGARDWFQQPVNGKHIAANWKKFTLGVVRWPMNCIMTDAWKRRAKLPRRLQAVHLTARTELALVGVTLVICATPRKRT